MSKLFHKWIKIVESRSLDKSPSPKPNDVCDNWLSCDVCLSPIPSLKTPPFMVASLLAIESSTVCCTIAWWWPHTVLKGWRLSRDRGFVDYITACFRSRWVTIGYRWHTITRSIISMLSSHCTVIHLSVVCRQDWVQYLATNSKVDALLSIPAPSVRAER